MSLKIRDSKLSSLYGDLEKKAATDKSVKLDDSNVLSLLAAVADSSSSSYASALKKLQAPGLTLGQQVAIVQKGLSDSEKADLTAILDQGTVPLADSAKGFLEAVVGRAPKPATGVPLQISAKLDHGQLVGSTSAGATLEIANESTAPSTGSHFDDTVELGKADASGKVALNVPTAKFQEGDVVRVRARMADGGVSDWTTMKLSGTGQADTRNAALALTKLQLTDAGGGKVSLANADASIPLSEPGAKLQITNVKTGAKTQVTLDVTGNLPKGFSVAGSAGDSFAFAISDGTNNASFATEAGRLTLGGKPPANDLPDPKLHHDQINKDGTPQNTKVRFTGPLFQNGVDIADVQQGYLGDCYFCTAISAIAKDHPEVIQNMIKDNGDGTYTVTWKQRDWRSGKYQDATVKVDGDLYVKPAGTPLYARSNGDKTSANMELWFPLLEKAYAAWKGSYDTIGSGGLASDVFEAALGKPATDNSIKYMNADTLWTQIKSGIDAKRPLAAGTYGEDQDAMYTNTGVYADHAYALIGYKEEAGTKYVQLRNPWGYSEPAGDGVDDGVFWLKMSDFTKLYSTFMASQG
jgi:hypothetical protein